jgi:hypothetical protein
LFSFVLVLTLFLMGSFNIKPANAYVLGCSGAGPYNTMTGQLCTKAPIRKDCAVGDLYSSLTGLPCSGNTTSTAPTITISSPNGGEQWAIGSTQTIQWTSTSAPSNGHVELYLVKTGKLFPLSNATNLPATGSFNWTIPTTLCGNADLSVCTYLPSTIDNKIEAFLTGTYNGTLQDVASGTSNATFSITSGNFPPGCTSTSGFSTTTGMNCGGTTTQTNPIISGVSGPQTLNVNQQGTWTVKAVDPSGGYLGYGVLWGDSVAPYTSATNMSPVTADQQSATFTHAYSRAGTFTPTFTVTSTTNGNSAQTSLSVVVAGIATLPPVSTIPQVQNLKATVAVGDPATVSLSWSPVTIANNQGVSTEYAIYRSMTSGFTPNASNLIGWNSSTTYNDQSMVSGTIGGANTVNGIYYYVVAAGDWKNNLGPVSTQVSAIVGVTTTTPTLSITTPSQLPNATAGQYYFTSLNVTGGNGNYTWGLINNAGLVNNTSAFPINGLGFSQSYTQSPYSGNAILGTPASNTSGTYTITVNVISGSQITARQFTLTVDPATTTPTCTASGFDSSTGLPCGCTSTSGFSLTTGLSCGGNTQAPTVTISANPTSINYGDSSTLNWSSTNATSCVGTNGTAVWFGNHSTSGSVSTPPLGATYTYTITCSNSVGVSATASATINVAPQTVQIYPAGCTSTTGYSPTTGQACNGSGSPTYPTSWPVESAGCSSTVGYSPTTGLPCSGGGTTTTTPSISRVPSLQATISTATPTSVNLSWSAATATNGINYYNVYRSNVLIAQTQGLSYTDVNLSPGYYYYTVAAVDTSGNVGPTAAVSATITTPALTITTSSPLPSTTVGIYYTQNIGVTGNSDYYTWSVSSGSLPPGIVLNPSLCPTSPCSGSGILSGSPTVAGTYNFTLNMVSGSKSTTKQFSLTVNPATTTPTTPVSSGGHCSVSGNASACMSYTGGQGGICSCNANSSNCSACSGIWTN